jgi:hypothetical protein
VSSELYEAAGGAEKQSSRLEGEEGGAEQHDDEGRMPTQVAINDPSWDRRKTCTVRGVACVSVGICDMTWIGSCLLVL